MIIEMEEKDSKGRLALERNVQKAFKCVEIFYTPLQTVLPEMLTTVTSVANILEQLECCKSLDSNVPITSFCEVKAHLILKLEAEIANRLEELKDKIQVLKEKQEVVSKFCQSSRSLIQKYSASLSLASVSMTTPVKPSIADMIEWLEDIDHLLFEQYHSKLHLVDTAARGEGLDSHNLVTLWKDQDTALLNLITDYLSRVGHFLDEKI